MIIAWAPSSARTISLFMTAGSAPMGRAATLLPLRWPPKRQGETLDYGLDLSVLQASPSDIVTITVNSAGGCELAASVVIGGIAVLWLSGGAIGDNAIDLSVAFASGRRVRRIVRLEVCP